MNKKIVASVLILVVLVVVGVKLFDSEKNQGQVVIPGDDNLLGLRVGNNALNINEQKAGRKANLSFVVLEKKGYAVIYTKDNEVAGKVIGVSSLLDAKEHSNVSASLEGELKIGSSYIAKLYFDNGDGVFDVATDLPVKNDEDIIMMEFQVSAKGADDNVITY